MKLPKQLDHRRKGLINIQNIDDNECFKCCLVRYLHPADNNPRRITKADKYFVKKLDFKVIKLPVKVRDVHKIEKKNSIGISVFGYENKEKHPIYVSKICCEEKHVDLLFIEEKSKRHHIFTKDFNTFMYDHTFHCRRKYFCRYCFQAFSTEEISKSHIKDCFTINGKQKIIMPKKSKYVKVKTKVTIYDLCRFWKYISAIEDNGEQNPKESYTNKCQEHIACSYAYKLVCVDDKFSTSFKR